MAVAAVVAVEHAASWCTCSREVVHATSGYDQITLDLIGFFKGLRANVGVPSGLITEVALTWFVLLLAVTGRIAIPKGWQMCRYICIGANSQNFANKGAFVTCQKLSGSRGIMLGLLKGFVGLSGAIMTLLFLAIYGNDSKDLILLIGWLPASDNVSCQTTERGSNILPVLYASIVLAFFLMIMNADQKLVVFSRGSFAGTATLFFLLELCHSQADRLTVGADSATAACALLFVPLFIAMREVRHQLNQTQKRKTQRSPPNVLIVFSQIMQKLERGEETLHNLTSTVEYRRGFFYGYNLWAGLEPTRDGQFGSSWRVARIPSSNRELIRVTGHWSAYGPTLGESFLGSCQKFRFKIIRSPGLL
ncbi:Nodulin-like [Dillenia turbinata]|uniref:Nodulin-like n=1 Tax=Dillenia turbinata TaxID=194707 RepID=A0AAN8ZJ96_9MAGN